MSSPKATAPAARARSKAVAAAVDNRSCLEALMDTVGAAVREHGDDQTKLALESGGQVQVIADWFLMARVLYDGKVVPLNARTCASDAS